MSSTIHLPAFTSALRLVLPMYHHVRDDRGNDPVLLPEDKRFT